jgi:Protein of unknwon function (DUF3008)
MTFFHDINKKLKKIVESTQLDEFRRSKRFDDDDEDSGVSYIVQQVDKLLKSGNKVDSRILGSMGHVVNAEPEETEWGNGGIRMKPINKPYSRRILYRPFLKRDDHKYEIIMKSPGYFVIQDKANAKDELDELSPQTLQSYKSKALNYMDKAVDSLRGSDKGMPGNHKTKGKPIPVEPDKIKNRVDGIKTAQKKLKREDNNDIDEAPRQSMGGALRNELSKAEPGSKLDKMIKHHNAMMRDFGTKMLDKAPSGYHFDKKGLLRLGELNEKDEQLDEEGDLVEAKGYEVIQRLVKEFNTQASGNEFTPLDYKLPGSRVWTRGDGSRHRDPGYIYLDKYLRPEQAEEWRAQNPVDQFWKWMISKGAKQVGDVSGEFGSDPHRPAVTLGGLLFTKGDHNITWGSKSRLKNSNVWRQKKLAEKDELDELSPHTLGSYVKKAAHEVGYHGGVASHYRQDRNRAGEREHDYKKEKRERGIGKAIDKIVGAPVDESQLDELSPKRLKTYLKKSNKDANDIALRALNARDSGDFEGEKKIASKLGDRLTGQTRAEKKLASMESIENKGNTMYNKITNEEADGLSAIKRLLGAIVGAPDQEQEESGCQCGGTCPKCSSGAADHVVDMRKMADIVDGKVDESWDDDDDDDDVRRAENELKKHNVTLPKVKHKEVELDHDKDEELDERAGPVDGKDWQASWHKGGKVSESLDDDWGNMSRREFKRRELEYELGDEESHNGYAVLINGRVWKAFRSKRQAEAVVRTLKGKGKDAKMIYGAFFESAEDKALEESIRIVEKWGNDYETPKSKKGMFKGKSKAELEKQYNNLKKSGPHKKGSAEYTKMKELGFAIRAKGDWGKVDEDESPSAGLSKAKKSAVAKKARSGGDIGKKGKGFDAVAKKAGGGEKGKKIAAAAMWKNIKRESVDFAIFANTILELRESAMQLDELSKDTMHGYLQKSMSQKFAGTEKKDRMPGMKKAYKKVTGQSKGGKKEELDELSKDTLNSYIKKSTHDDRGERVSNSPKRSAGIKKAATRTQGKLPSGKIYKDYKGGKKEELDELSTDTLKSYGKKAAVDTLKHGVLAGKNRNGDWNIYNKSMKKAKNRADGIDRAVDRLAGKKGGKKEELDELSKDTLKSYADKRGDQYFKQKKPVGFKELDNLARGIKKYKDKVKVEKVDELSTDTLKSYAKKSGKSADKSYDLANKAAQRSNKGRKSDMDQFMKHSEKFGKRKAGQELASKKLKRRGEELDEKAVSKAQQKFMGMVHAAQEGEKPASKKVAKVARTMKKGDAEDFASTKRKGLPSHKTPKKVKETTTSGSVATSETPQNAAPKSGGSFQFGKGVYEAMNSELEKLINEGITVNVNFGAQDQNGEPQKSISINADGDDAEKLANLLNLAGLSSGEDKSELDAEIVDENQPDWPTNTEYSDDALQYSGGLNKPKYTGQTTIPVIASQLDRQVDEGIERSLFDLYKTIKGE